MARSENQKLKLLYLAKIFLEQTDEQHVITMPEILRELEACEIQAERKSIYTDLDMLRRFGMQIEQRREPNAGYCLADRQFELSELKILVDAVQASKFIPTQKSRELIKKLETLTSRYKAQKLQRQVFVMNRAKSMNKSIFNHVDIIHEAMSLNAQIRFCYFAWNAQKEPKLKRDGRYYQVSPWSLAWEGENYYLISFDRDAQKVKFYRVDKMLDLELTEETREGKEEFAGFDVADFTKKTFSMFNGEEQTVTLRMENHLAGVIIDRFGMDIPMRRIDEDTFQVRITVRVSSQFYGWLAGLGKSVRITSPKEEAENYKKYLKKILKEYK